MAARAYWSPPVHVLTHELFGGGVRNGADGRVGRGDADGVIEGAGDTEVSKENLPVIAGKVGDEDVGGLDISVQQPLLVGVIQRAATAVIRRRRVRRACLPDTVVVSAGSRRFRRCSPSRSTADLRVPLDHVFQRCAGAVYLRPGRLRE